MTRENRLEHLQDRCSALCRLVRITAGDYPILTVALSVLCAAAGVLYAFRDLGFVTSGRDLLPPGAVYVQRDREYGRDFGETNGITVVVEGATFARMETYANRLASDLDKHPEKFERVTYRIDPRALEGRALLYLSTKELSAIRDKLFDYRRFLTSFARQPTLDGLIENTKTEVVSGFVSHVLDLGLSEDGTPVNLDFVRDLLAQISTRLDGDAPFRSPWGSLLSFDPHTSDRGYFLSDDKRLLFILIEPAGKEAAFAEHRDVIETLRAMIADLKREYPDVNVGVTGAQTLSNDEMVAAFRDSGRATILAFTLTLGLLLLAFRRVAMPTLMLATLAVSLCWSIGIITLVVGHLSIFSVMFVSIVVGIGIDYGIYFLFRHDEELLLGRDERAALETTATRSGPGMLSGSLTAAGTFYVLMATDFRGIQELGFVAGTAILSAWLSMMTLFPALIMLAARRRAARRSGAALPAERDRVSIPLIEHITRYPKTVAAASVTAAALSLVALRTVPFDYNLLHLQAAGTESVVWEQRILATAGRSSFSALATAGSLAELRRKAEAFRRLGSVSDVDSVLDLVPAHQAEKRKLIAQFAPVVAPVRVDTPGPLDVDRVRTAIQTLEHRLDLAVHETTPGRDRDEVVTVRDQAATLARKLERTADGIARPRLARLQRQIYRDFVHTLDELQRNLRPRPLRVRDLPAELHRQFVGRSGRFLLQIQPSVDIWDRLGAERFVTELRGVDPEVTGVPIITFEAIRAMQRSYQQGTVYAFILVGVLSALTFRRRRETTIAMLPLVLGALWTIGLMRVFHLPFNLGNVFGFPLIIGAGAEFGLNVVLRHLEERQHGGPTLARSTALAVLLNGLTTIVGFGSLMIADHRGIFGLGLLLTLGMVATLTAALVVLPATLRWATRRRPAPARNANGRASNFEPERTTSSDEPGAATRT